MATIHLDTYLEPINFASPDTTHACLLHEWRVHNSKFTVSKRRMKCLKDGMERAWRDSIDIELALLVMPYDDERIPQLKRDLKIQKALYRLCKFLSAIAVEV